MRTINQRIAMLIGRMYMFLSADPSPFGRQAAIQKDGGIEDVRIRIHGAKDATRNRHGSLMEAIGREHPIYENVLDD
jgi:hypothetical protein